MRTRAGRILDTPTHHIMHREKVGSNYGLYFNWWDRLMGTNHADYERRFARVSGSAATPEAVARAPAPAAG